MEPVAGQLGARGWNFTGHLQYYVERPSHDYMCALCGGGVGPRQGHWTEECSTRKQDDLERCGWCIIA